MRRLSWRFCIRIVTIVLVTSFALRLLTQLANNGGGSNTLSYAIADLEEVITYDPEPDDGKIAQTSNSGAELKVTGRGSDEGKIRGKLLELATANNNSVKKLQLVNSLNELQFVVNLNILSGRSSQPENKGDSTLASTASNSTEAVAEVKPKQASDLTQVDANYHIEFVILIQMHDRVEYLRELLNSFRTVKLIERALVIVSHDFYSEKVDELMKSIDFCPLLQIFYPYAASWFSGMYPADDPRDCSRNTPIEQAKKDKCLNADWPDSYAHYREVKFTQTKQHYIWKMAHVFGRLHILRGYSGPVILLEEDHYVTPDLLTFARLAGNFRNEDKKNLKDGQVSILSLGRYKDGSPTSSNTLSRTLFMSVPDNMGMMVDRSFWAAFKTCAMPYCEYDDYNWDWTLQHLSRSNCFKDGLAVYTAEVGRVHHIGRCGIHFGNGPCNAAADATAERQRMQPVLRQMAEVKEIQLGQNANPYTDGNKRKPNGGWGDQRDIELCKVNLLGPGRYLESVRNKKSAAIEMIVSLLNFTSVK